jgi:hypothetical protein
MTGTQPLSTTIHHDQPLVDGVHHHYMYIYIYVADKEQINIIV